MLFLQFKIAHVGGMEEEKCGKRDNSCLTYRKKGRFCGKRESFSLVYRTFRGNISLSPSPDLSGYKKKPSQVLVMAFFII